MSNELIKYLDKYNEVFDDGFPTIPLLIGKEDEEVIEMIKNCLKENKDVIEMGYYTQDKYIKY